MNLIVDCFVFIAFRKNTTCAALAAFGVNDVFARDVAASVVLTALTIGGLLNDVLGNTRQLEEAAVLLDVAKLGLAGEQLETSLEA